MQSRSVRPIVLLVAIFLVVGLCSVDVDAQRRRKRRVRRVPRPVITNPTIVPPGSEQDSNTGGEKIISTTDENSTETEQTSESAQAKRSRSGKKAANEQDMQQTINALSNQIDRLNDKLSRMQENDRSLIDMERLTRAEQRAENLRAQLVDTESKLADLQSKLDQIDYALKPENIERASGFGTVHPEEARDARRRQLEAEKGRIQAQIRILETSRTRLETSIATADTEVDRLRQRLETQQQDSSGTSSTETRPANTRRP